MDGERLDDLIKRFSVTRITRLEALRGMVAGAGLALTAATLAAVEADAKDKGKGKGKGKVKGKDKKGNAHAQHIGNCPPDGQYCSDPSHCCSYESCYDDYKQKFLCGPCST